MKKFKVCLIICVFLFSFISLFTCYDCIAKGVTSGLYLCADVIIPSLFPVLCITSCLANSGVLVIASKYLGSISKKLFNMSGYFIPVFLLSLISGYPVGASLSNSLYENGRISIEERNNIAAVSCSAGPGFVVLAVGVNMFNSYDIGILLLISHICASVFTAIIVTRFYKYEQFASEREFSNIYISDALVKGVGSASSSIIAICAYTVLFSAVVNVISKYLRATPFYLPIVSVLEVTNASFALSEVNVPLAIIAAVIGFGGFSVIFQVSSVLKNNRPPVSRIILIRLLHSGLSFVFCSILLNFFNISKPVIKTTETYLKTSSKNILFSLSLIFLLVVFLNYFYKRKKNVEYF